MTNEKRLNLIDRNALMKEHCEGCAADIQEMCKTDPVCASMMWVVDAPTVDAVEVVHGRWIEHIEIGAMNNHYECSVCHWKTPSFTIAKGSNYCPNCGAKMDGDGNGN